MDTSSTPVPQSASETDNEPTQTRWGKRTRADSEYAREHILEAALRCYMREGVVKTTVEHVAREAKISRTTVYRYFKNRDEVLTAVVLSEANIVIKRLKTRLDKINSLGDVLVEAVMFGLEIAPEMPLYPLAFGPEGSALTSRLCFSSSELYSLGERVFRSHFDRALNNGEIPADTDIYAMMEWLVRMLMSYMSTPSVVMQEPEKLRRQLQIFLRPIAKGAHLADD